VEVKVMTMRAWSGSFVAAAVALLLAGCASGPPPVKPTAGDLERLRAAEQQALEEARTGQAVNWHNPKTGHSGSVVVLETEPSGEDGRALPCRRIKRVFAAGETTRSGTAYACRTASGDWTIEREESLLTRDQRVSRQRVPYHHHRHGVFGRGSGVGVGFGFGL
jgi:surface antigen